MLVTTDFRSLLEVILFCLRVSRHMLLSSASWWRLKILVSAYHTHICELTNNISDIERTYGQKKLLAARFPLQQDQSLAQKRRLTQANHQRSVSTASAATDVSTLSTPAATEGETATETEEIDTETETELDGLDDGLIQTPRVGSPISMDSNSDSRSFKSRSKAQSQHDLINTYFRKDLVLFHNFDMLRYVFLPYD